MAGISPTWLAKTVEPILEPELAIIDPHHHLWDFPEHRYLLPDILADTGSGHNVCQTVFLECMACYRAAGPEAEKPIGEVEFVTGQAAMSASGQYGATRVATGIVGFADLRLGAAVEDVLVKQVTAGGGRFKGIRFVASFDDKEPQIHNGHTNPTATIYRDDRRFQEGFAVLGKLGLTFDAWLYHTGLPTLISLARSFPEQPIVLDHCGGPLGLGYWASRRDEVFADWRRDIVELARCENVTIKLGGLGMRVNGFDFHSRERPPTSEDLATAWRPYIETCIEAFGAKRAMFESNFPVDKLSGSYAVYWNAFKRLAAGASADEKAQLFRETARAFYSLPRLE
ncbi:MAG: amidohydrolase family protein [Proteobacteria bacterium]|nr:amidohydrolase family protein [Pseudomonadota bacterium]